MDSGDTSWVRLVVPLAVMILWAIVSAIGKKNKSQRQAGSPFKEAKLPGENIIDNVFGPYIQRRRQEAEARPGIVVIEDEEEEEEDVEEEEEVVRKVRPRPVPEIRIIEERRLRPSELKPSVAAVVTQEPRGRSLDEILFANRNLTPGAKMILASEILQRPRSLRR